MEVTFIYNTYISFDSSRTICRDFLDRTKATRTIATIVLFRYNHYERSQNYRVRCWHQGYARCENLL
ncbi:MAG: hypothetical protein ACI90V_001374 [Bacillariaceae sp.]|jgi:hypothetical protein